MDKPDYKRSAVLGCSLFGVLYIISAIGLVMVGVYAIIEEGIVFGLKSPLWIGGALFLAGIITISMAFWGKDTYLGSMVLLVVSVAVIMLCFASMLLLEFVEKARIFRSVSRDQSVTADGVQTKETPWRSPYIVFLVYLLSSVVGLASALVGFLYIFCILIAPVRRQEWKAWKAYPFRHQGRDQGLNQRTNSKYSTKKPGQQDVEDDQVEMKCHEPVFPRPTWIYDAQSVDSVEIHHHKAAPVRQMTLNKEVVEELQHHSTFMEHQYLTRPSPSPSPEKEIPPPPPHPPTPPPLASNACPQGDVGLERNDEKHSTARSLEHYPIPRKYSAKGAAYRRSWKQHPSGRQSTIQHQWSRDGSTFKRGKEATEDQDQSRERKDGAHDPVNQDPQPPTTDKSHQPVGDAGGLDSCPADVNERCHQEMPAGENAPVSQAHGEALGVSHPNQSEKISAERVPEAPTSMQHQPTQTRSHKPLRKCQSEEVTRGCVNVVQPHQRSVGALDIETAAREHQGTMEIQSYPDTRKSHPKPIRHCHGAEGSMQHLDHHIRPQRRLVPASNTRVLDNMQEMHIMVNPLQQSPRHIGTTETHKDVAQYNHRDDRMTYEQEHQRQMENADASKGPVFMESVGKADQVPHLALAEKTTGSLQDTRMGPPQHCQLPTGTANYRPSMPQHQQRPPRTADTQKNPVQPYQGCIPTRRDHLPKPLHHRQRSVCAPAVHPKPSLRRQNLVGNAREKSQVPRGAPGGEERSHATETECHKTDDRRTQEDQRQEMERDQPCDGGAGGNGGDDGHVDHLQPRCTSLNLKMAPTNHCIVASTRL